MPKSRKPLKQKSVLDFFESGSSPRGQVGSGPSVRKQARLDGYTKSDSPTRRKKPTRVSTRRENGSVSEGDGSTSSDVGAIEFQPEVITVSSSSEEEAIVKSPRRSHATRRAARKRRAASDEGSTTDTESDSDGPEPIGVPITLKKSRATALAKRKRTAIQDSDDDEPQPRRSKLIKGVRPPTPEEEGSDLLAEVDSNKIIDSRLRVRGKKSTFLQNLEKLKRKKMKQLESDERSESQTDSEEDVVPFAGAKPHVGSDSDGSQESEDEGLGGFIEEDSINAVAPELPVEFSMNTFQDLMHHFKIICQLFVHLAVQDPDDRHAFMKQSLKDQYFSVPLLIARRKLAGMRDSSVTSSVWRTPFKKALETYPVLETVPVDFASPGCDACNLGGRMSTLIGRVSGDPYDKVTFEPLVSQDSSDSNDEEEDKVKKEFNLGRFCARRTRVFHRFTHWEYMLFQSLDQEVEDLKNRSTQRRVFVPVAYAGGTKPPDNLTDADGIMNWLDERGVITAEWHKLKEMMDSATNLEVASKRGDDDD